MLHKINDNSSLTCVSTVSGLRQIVKNWRTDGLSVGYVPTMGALHDGHMSLIEMALSKTNRVITSIFVNPTQFGVNEDLDKYPRPIEQDIQKLKNIGTHCLFTPSVSEMYPDAFSTSIRVKNITKNLCGDMRPGHFDGVALIVTKLLLQALPDIAFFGEKDYQQLCVIKRMVQDLNIPTEIQGCPIIREDDGLALSSRNIYLSADERQRALTLSKTLFSMTIKLENNPDGLKNILKWGYNALNKAGYDKVDYLEICDAQNLEPITELTKPARILSAIRLGNTRLIDNVAVSVD